MKKLRIAYGNSPVFCKSSASDMRAMRSARDLEFRRIQENSGDERAAGMAGAHVRPRDLSLPRVRHGVHMHAATGVTRVCICIPLPSR